MFDRFAAVAAVGLTALPATAQEASPPPLTPLSVEVVKLDTVLHSDVNAGSICCAPETLVSGEAEDFVYIKVVFDVAWSDDVDRVSYSGSQEQALKLPGTDDPDAWLRPWGQINWYPSVEIRPPNLSESRPRNWPDEDKDAVLSGMWTVPADATEAVLLIGKADEPQLEVAIDLSGAVEDLPAAATLWDVSISSLSVMDEVPTSRESRGRVVNGVVKPTMGQIVAVTATITPTRNTLVDQDEGKNAAYFQTETFQLVGPEGLPLVPMGQDRRGTIGNDVSNTENWSGDEASGQTERTFYYLGSGAPGTYRLFLETSEVATADLG
ncbi:MAG: hypothetical protein VX874_10475 [Pseudomonadota bacterium]|nr:hypothetical protein [Pseudomonadota bacterium]